MAYRRRTSARRASARRSAGRSAGYRVRGSRSASRGVRAGGQRIRIELVHSTAPSVSRPAELIGMKPAEPQATARF